MTPFTPALALAVSMPVLAALAYHDLRRMRVPRYLLYLLVLANLAVIPFLPLTERFLAGIAAVVMFVVIGFAMRAQPADMAASSLALSNPAGALGGLLLYLLLSNHISPRSRKPFYFYYAVAFAAVEIILLILSGTGLPLFKH